MASNDDNLTPRDGFQPPPQPPELPPATEYEQVADAVSGYFASLQDWAAGYAASVRERMGTGAETPGFPELPAVAEDDKMGKAFTEHLANIQEWADRFATTMRDVNLDNAADIAQMRQDIERLADAETANGPFAVPPLTVERPLPAIVGTAVAPLAGTDGVLVHHVPDRHIVFGDSDPVAEDVFMRGGGGGAGAEVTGDEVWISVTGENFVSHIGPGPVVYENPQLGESGTYLALTRLRWDARGHIVCVGYADCIALTDDDNWIITGQ